MNSYTRWRNQQRQLREELERVVPGASLCDDDMQRGSPIKWKAREHTPLLMAGEYVVNLPDAVATTAALDLKVLALQLDVDEYATVLADAKQSTLSIVKLELPQLIVMSAPLMVAVVLETFPNALLSMMAGHTDASQSAQILAAFTLSFQFQQLTINAITDGFGSAMDTAYAQAFCAKRLRDLWMFMQAGCLVSVASIPFTVVATLRSAWILRALGQDPVIAGLVSNVLLINLTALPFTLLFSLLKSTLQAQNIVTPLAMVSLVGWSVSLPIAYLLGFYTSLGYMGVAISMVCYSTIKCLTVVPVVMRNAVFQQVWPGWQPREASRLLPTIARLGVSIMLMVLFQIAGFTGISILAGLLPNTAVVIAANTIFVSVSTLTFMPLGGMCIAGAIRMANALGAGPGAACRDHRRHRHDRESCCIHRGGAGQRDDSRALCTKLHGRRRDRAYRHPHDLETTAIVPMLGFMLGIQSVFCACGKQWLCAQLNFVFLCTVGVPLGFLLAVTFDGGIAGLWYGEMMGLLLFVVTCCFWLATANWHTMAHEARLGKRLHVEAEKEEEPAPEPVTSDVAKL